MQYYYLGNLEKSKYYNDRCMRGKSEKKESKLRKVFEGQFDRSFSKKERITFKKLKQILESFSQIKDDVVRTRKCKNLAATFGTGNL
jgi:hypothetical protein